MAKYLLFQNNEFYRMAPNEAKRDNWLRTPNIVAKEVSDADYKKVGCKKFTLSPTLSGDTINYNEETNLEQSFDLIGNCIDKIYNEEEVWSTADCTKKEVKEFLEGMNSMQFKEVEKFFETMPKLSHTLNVTNPRTKVESEVVLEGLASFFA